ncbi:MAG TPA: hypothetical protein VJ600_04695 [Holophagaceae bacterium]|nr:hypothetical protein [Holophagaceae bacterium]
MSSGPTGSQQEAFEKGLRFLVAALALDVDHRHGGAITSAACDAIRCFIQVFEAAAEQHLPDPEGEIRRLRNQLEALLTPGQDPQDAARHALEAACLARDQAAAVLPRLSMRPQES